jgi:LysM repeat protein
MKILKIFGIVAGVHALALLMIFANPGCSSSKAQAAAGGKSDAPAPVAAPGDAAPTPVAAAPADAAPAPAGPILYSPTRPNTPAAAALEAQPVANVTPASTYTVVSHDTLSTIAKKNHLKTSELAAANHLRAGSPLHVGQKILIPTKAAAAPAPGAESPGPMAAGAPAAGGAAGLAEAKPTAEPTRHTVKAGESLGKIAHMYHVRVGDIATANNISDPQKIRPGQELIIPGASAGKAGPTKPARAAKAKAAADTAPMPADAGPPPAALPAPVDAAPKPDAPSTDIPVIKIDENPPAPAPKS